ncbi:CBS domain-containing protein [Amycolatopsis tucumanensis]|uniref:CBS domain-containing protein n=1 Tax=Amycolatopsis tucumanensis TaxID=401106 RepID=A0ABP7IE47_9PSEU|nr:CBS domain-containing protein [Amycolatopsis tucumanensis]MCF6426870.1 CBS domain-containing protein [Amycolatopsis tucumanensis]
MAQLVRDVMTPNPVTLSADTPVRQAAQAMREKDIGNVLVRDGDRLAGIVTDRDLVVRALAEKDDPRSCTLGEVCSGELVTARPEEPADAAIQRMRQHAVRRIAVVDHDRPVGVVSVGDAAIERDPSSTLGDISAARGNA